MSDINELVEEALEKESELVESFIAAIGSEFPDKDFNEIRLVVQRGPRGVPSRWWLEERDPETSDEL